MDVEKLIHQLNDIRKRLSADNADAIACATEIVKKQRPERVLEFTVPVFTTNGHHEEVNVNSCPTCFGTVEHTFALFVMGFVIFSLTKNSRSMLQFRKRMT